MNDGLGRQIVMLDQDLFSIGQGSENDLWLAGPEVSGVHAEIIKENGDWILRDKGSRYGTYVNDQAVTERMLMHGDRVQFGRAGGYAVFQTRDGRMADAVREAAADAVAAEIRKKS